MKVLSLFDGMSCGRIALDQLGIPVKKYYASEIDKYAIQVSQANYPEIEQVGDICNLDPKDYQDVDLMLAGSPCQGFSFAGKQLAFDDPRSALFFEFIRLLKAIKPKYFLLENVRMKKEFLDVITQQVSECYEADDVAPEFKDMLGNVTIKPHFINSSLVSAQSRQRYYWTNIPGIKQPEDRGIVLRDILETREIDGLSEKAINYMNRGSEKYTRTKTRAEHYIKHESEKSKTLTANMHKGVPYGVIAVDKPVETKPKKAYDIPREILKDNERQRRVYDPSGKSPTILGRSDSPKITTPKQIGVAVDVNGHDQIKRVYSPDGKSPTVTTCGGGHREPKVVVGGAFRARSKNKDGKHVDWKETKPEQMLELRKDNKSNAVSTVSKDSLVVKGGRVVGRAYDKDGKRMDRFGDSVAGKTKQTLEVREDDKTNAITTVGKDSVAVNEDLTWRKLTPLECERLQTVPDNYTNHVSNTRRYAMLGNGWTIEVIKHILQNMEIE